jgi:hypothetical protein
MSNSLMLTMTNAVPGREADFEAWYAGQHFSDLLRVPSILKAKLHTATEVRTPYKWRHAAVYDLDGEPVAAMTTMFEFSKANPGQPTDAMDRAATLLAIATPITERISVNGAAPDPDNYLFLVLTNPREGQEDEYNHWYNGQHVTDVLKLPGFVGVQRFRLSSHPTMPAPKWSYLAFYEIDRDKVAEAFAALDKVRGTPAMPTSPALKSEDNETAVYRPVTTRVKGE